VQFHFPVVKNVLEGICQNALEKNNKRVIKNVKVVSIKWKDSVTQEIFNESDQQKRCCRNWPRCDSQQEEDLQIWKLS